MQNCDLNCDLNCDHAVYTWKLQVHQQKEILKCSLHPFASVREQFDGCSHFIQVQLQRKNETLISCSETNEVSLNQEYKSNF